MRRLEAQLELSRRRTRALGRRLINPIERRVGPPLGYRFGTTTIEIMSGDDVLEAGYHSQIGQDVLLDRHVFCGRTDGIFVDVGAHDGVNCSNTAFFERNRNWTGLCIEPNPDVFAALTAARTATCLQLAIGVGSGSRPFRVVTGASMLSGLADKYDRRHAARVDRESARTGGSSRIENVEVKRLDVVLLDCGIDSVDLLSIDVEGAETDVIDSIRLADFSVRAVIIENNFRSWTIARKMIAQGYQLIARLGWDELYLPAPTTLAESQRSRRPDNDNASM